MDFRLHYERELEHLLHAGKAFSKVHDQARHLAQRSGDPDVERLLEGFAFLSAKVQARLDSAHPQIIQHLCELMAPHQLRPIPASTIVEFRNDPAKGRSAVELPLHAPVCSSRIQDIPIEFRCTQALRVLPMQVHAVQLLQRGPHANRLSLTLRIAPTTTRLLRDQGYLDLHIHDTPSKSCDLLFSLYRQCHALSVECLDENFSKLGEPQTLSPRFELVGLRDDAALLPWPQRAWRGQRLLAEFLTLPQKFHQLRVFELSSLRQEPHAAYLRLNFDLQHCPNSLASLDPQAIRLHCSPAINLFERDAEPLRQRALGHPQRIRAVDLAPEHFEVFDIQKATLLPNASDERVSVESFFRNPCPPDGLSYVLERRSCELDRHSNAYIRLLRPTRAGLPSKDLLSLELLCTHRALSCELSVGDIHKSLRPLASHIELRNLTVPTRPSSPSLEGELQWRLFALSALKRSSLPDLSHLHAIVDLYNAQAQLGTAQGISNTQIKQALRGLHHTHCTGLLNGLPVRGRESHIEVEEHNLTVGQIFVLGQVLDELFSDLAALNQIQQTNLTMYPSGQVLHWPARSGTQVLSS